jgi:hypothetical protein
VLAREERDDAIARNVAPEIVDEMTKIVFFLRSDSAIGEKHRDRLSREPADAVIGVDPGVDALGRIEAGARRAQLRGDDRGRSIQDVCEGALPAGTRFGRAVARL